MNFDLTEEQKLFAESVRKFALAHLEKDFLFHADTFTDEAFVEDDPEAVATRVEETAPDLLIGTHLEREVAGALDVPFLPLFPPVFEHPFVERPLMGYAGSSVLADALEGALREQQGPCSKKSEPETRAPQWTEKALEELEAWPAFQIHLLKVVHPSPQTIHRSLHRTD